MTYLIITLSIALFLISGCSGEKLDSESSSSASRSVESHPISSTSQVSSSDASSQIPLSSTSSQSSSPFMGIDTLVVRGAEAGFCDIDGTLDDNHSGFTGTEFLNVNNELGSAINWQLDTRMQGMHRIEFRFANGSTFLRSGQLLVNGKNTEVVSFMPTVGWDDWQSVAVLVHLDAGGNKLSLVSASSEGLANIDAIKIEGASAAGQCPNRFTTEGDGEFRINGPYGLSDLAQTPLPNVPRGSVLDFYLANSPIFTNINRRIWVYIPESLPQDRAVAVMVLHDGRAYINDFGLPNVLDQLIAMGDIPPMVAIFVDNADPAGYGAARSAEYDCVNDRNAHYMIDEVLPAVEAQFNLRFSTNPWDRAIGGHSSGGAAAFTAAWHRPDQFRRVLTHSGSFTDLCREGSPGSHNYPNWVVEEPKKPLRIFLLAGENDIGAGTGGTHDWVKMNAEMSAALALRGYQYQYVYAQGGSHNRNAGASILPDTLRWLWRTPLAGE